MMHIADASFLIIVLLATVLFYAAAAGLRKTLIIYLIWCLALTVLALNGFFKNTESLPPRLLIVIIAAAAFVFYATKQTTALPVKRNYLLIIHTLRFPVELVLYKLFLSGLVPQSMTFKGWNFDVLTGISAIVLLLMPLFKVKLSQKLWVAWNVLGLILLGIVVITAVLSAPSPIQLLAFQQPNVAVLQFPYLLLPALVVPLVFLAHLLCLKQVSAGINLSQEKTQQLEIP